LTLDRADRRKGVLLMVGAGLCWSLGGILVRNVRAADPFEIIVWRSVFMAIFLVATIALMNRGRVIGSVRDMGAAGVLSGALLASTFFFFILSITRTTAANTFVLMSTVPFFVAVFALLFLGERVGARTWAAIAVALAGIGMMFAEGVEAGRLEGNLLALGVPLAAALNVVLLRRQRKRVDMVPAVLLAGLFSIVAALPFALPLTASAADLGVLALMGFIQLGLGCVLMTLATRHLAAGEIGLLALLETILGPIWVWIGIGERPSDLALVGGVIVLAALAVDSLPALRGLAPAAARR
jgi:drug/metabolite transporter (DMT)-like permease